MGDLVDMAERLALRDGGCSRRAANTTPAKRDVVSQPSPKAHPSAQEENDRLFVKQGRRLLKVIQQINDDDAKQAEAGLKNLEVELIDELKPIWELVSAHAAAWKADL